MSGGPVYTANPGAAPFDIVGALLFITIGFGILVFTRPLIRFQIWMSERQLKKLREKPPILAMRLVGAAFLAFGLLMFVMVVRAAR